MNEISWFQYSSFTFSHILGTVHAFSIGLSRDFDNTGSHKVIFDRVFTNQGGAFNVVTGVFTARVHGIYVFHYHSLSDLDHSVWLELYHNDHYVNSLFGHTSRGWTGGSNTATLQLAMHDNVYININRKTHNIVGASSEIYTTFQGTSWHLWHNKFVLRSNVFSFFSANLALNNNLSLIFSFPYHRIRFQAGNYI